MPCEPLVDNHLLIPLSAHVRNSERELNLNWKRAVEIFTTAQTQHCCCMRRGGGFVSFEVSSITGQSMNKSISRKRGRLAMSHPRNKIDCLLMRGRHIWVATVDCLSPIQSEVDGPAYAVLPIKDGVCQSSVYNQLHGMDNRSDY